MKNLSHLLEQILTTDIGYWNVFHLYIWLFTSLFTSLFTTCLLVCLLDH